MFCHSRDKSRFFTEDISGGIVGGILLWQGKIKSQGLENDIKSSKCRTNGKHNNTNKVKYIVNIHLSDKFDI